MNKRYFLFSLTVFLVILSAVFLSSITHNSSLLQEANKIEKRNVTTSLKDTLKPCDKLIYQGNISSNKIYLTFDDGYFLKNTRKILQTLKEKHVTATFFLEGAFLDTEVNTIRQMIEDGHSIGCHTWSHTDIRKMSNAKLKAEIERYEKRYFEITGLTLPKFFRPPMGCINDRTLKLLDDLGYFVFLWNVSFMDYNPSRDLGTDYVYRHVTTHTKNGSIILMHTLTESNANALGSIIDNLREQGYEFASLNDFVEHN